MHTRYRFIGKDGSMGYRNSKIYFGMIEINHDGSVVFIPLRPWAMVIPYDSLDQFLENWALPSKAKLKEVPHTRNSK